MSEAAATPEWNHEDHAELAHMGKTKKIVISASAHILVLLFFFGPLGDLVEKRSVSLSRENEVRTLGPIMTNLAAQGKRDAIIWVATYLPEQDHGRLATLAQQGDGEALFVLARVRAEAGASSAEVQHLRARSAEVGYPPAVRMALTVK